MNMAADLWQTMHYNPFLRGSVAATVLLILGGLVLRRFAARRVRMVAVRVGVLICSFLYALTATDALLHCFFTESHGSMATLASSRWYKRYWHPINSQGFRDVEHTKADLAGRKVVAVVGDSFVAGSGIRETRDRFANVLGRLLGDDWVPVIVAMPGWPTGDEAEALAAYPYPLNAVVLSYEIADISGAAARHGKPREAPRRLPKPAWLKPWINRSSLVNLVYSRWYAYANPDTSAAFWRYLEECFADEAIWAAHRAELLEIVRFCDARRVKLAVLIVPTLRDIPSSRAISSRVANLFAERGATVVNLTEILSGRKPSEMVVNPVDAHANVALNYEIAEHLHRALTSSYVTMLDKP